MKQEKHKSLHYRDDKAIKAFGKKVRALREAKGKTIEEFSNTVGLHPTQLGRIERGENNPTISYIVLIAKMLGVKPSELMEF